MPQYVSLKVSPDHLQVNPGEKVEAALSVQNVSQAVDVFTVDVQGLDVSWHKLSTNSTSLFPGDTAAITLSISVPKDSTGVARTYPFTIKATARKALADYVTIPCELVVTPFYEYAAEISPQKVTGAVGSYKIGLANNGNAELGFLLDGSDPETLCRFAFEPKEPKVAPGARQDVTATVYPGKRPLTGRPRLYNLTFNARPSQSTVAPAALTAQLEATPRLPKWAIPAAIASVVALVIIIVLVIVLWPNGETFEVRFLLDPRVDKTFGFELPASEPIRLEVVAQWRGTAENLDVTLERPDGNRSPTLKVSRADPSVEFALDQAAVNLGQEGWKVNLKNVSDAGQADGTLKVRRLNSR